MSTSEESAPSDKAQARFIGADEAGRGPWAGPIVAAAACFPNGIPTELASRLRDSKTISEVEREKIGTSLRNHTGCLWAIAECGAEEIDQTGIEPANRKVFEQALLSLLAKCTNVPYEILIDGKAKPLQLNGAPAKFIVRGESAHKEIAAASILAKTYRDKLLRKIGEEFPAYGFSRHKGYGTAEHSRALQEHGILIGIHRTTFLKNQLKKT